MMDVFTERNLVLRIIGYAIPKDKVTYNELIQDLKLNVAEQAFLRSQLINNNRAPNPNHILSRMDHEQGFSGSADLQLFPNAVFSYIDHLEIVEARKTAKESKHLSWIAIWISTGIGLVSLIVGAMQLYFQLARVN